jgi:hypothetical protein
VVASGIYKLGLGSFMVALFSAGILQLKAVHDGAASFIFWGSMIHHSLPLTVTENVRRRAAGDLSSVSITYKLFGAL